MAYSETQKRISLDADSSLAVFTGVPGQPGAADPNSGNQFRFVKVATAASHSAALATHAANEVVIGVVQNKPQYVGSAAEICIEGATQLQVGTGGLTAGQIVKSDANGQGVAGTPGTDAALAVVLIPAVAGALATVLLV